MEQTLTRRAFILSVLAIVATRERAHEERLLKQRLDDARYRLKAQIHASNYGMGRHCDNYLVQADAAARIWGML